MISASTQVYFASVTPLSDPALYRALLQTAPAERKTKLDAARTPEERYRFLGAWALLRHVLARHGITDARFTLGPYGKPYLHGNALFFNLSHSGDRVMCAVSSDEVGCDIERIRPLDLRIADRFFAPSEAERLRASASEQEKLDLFFRFWTLKESYMKATGEGLRILPSQCETVWQDGIPTLRVSPNGITYLFREYELDGYRAACCAKRGAPEAPRIIDLRKTISG